MHRLTRLPAIVLSLVTLAGVALGASAPVSYSARLVNFDEPGAPGPGLVQVRVTRWASDADRDALTSALLAEGQQGVLDVLKKMPEAGVIRTPGTAGYPFKYARSLTNADGEETVLVIIDRPIGFAEFRQGWQTIDYPFTIVELKLNDRGIGQGRLMAATRIDANAATRDISFEQYSASAMLLQSVRRE
jgi:hypothetical protein